MTICDLLMQMFHQSAGKLTFEQIAALELRMPDDLLIRKICLSDDLTKCYITDFDEVETHDGTI